MNNIVNKFYPPVDKFMPKRYLTQIGFTYSACEPFAKNKERVKKLMETGDTSCIYKNELDKDCF